MSRLQTESVVPARVVAALLALAGLLWILPFGLHALEGASASRQREAQAAQLAAVAVDGMSRSLQAVERVLSNARPGGDESQPEAAGLLGGLIRRVVVLEPGGDHTYSLLGQQEAAAPGGLAVGAPRPARDGGWVLPVLRAPEDATHRPAIALLDPARLLPEALPDAAQVLLLDHEGMVYASAGVAEEHLGRRLPGVIPTGVETARRWHGAAPIGGGAASLALVALPATRLVLLVVQPEPAAGWSTALWYGALLAGLALLGLAAWLVHAQRRRQLSALAAGRAQLALATAQLRLSSARAEEKHQQLELVLGGIEDGACLLDDQLRLVAWNDRFAELAGVPPEALRLGLPVGEVLRMQDAAGELDASNGWSLRRRLAELQARRSGSTVRQRADGARIEDRWTTLLDDSLLLTCRTLQAKVAAPTSARAPMNASGLASLCAEELRKRQPLLMEAAATGDLTLARTEAHAMRGVAANFGLSEVAEALRGVEAAARSNDVVALRGAMVSLPPLLDNGLSALLAKVA